MKLECPSCQAQYEVADSAIGPNGRNLRCAACGHYWFQKPNSVNDNIVNQKEIPNQIKVSKEIQKKQKGAAFDFAKIFAKKSPNAKHAPHEKMRKKVHDRIKFANLGAVAAGWILSFGVLGAIGFSMVQNRVAIVTKWPKSASFFSMLGVPVNLYGLEIQKIEVRSGADEHGRRIVVAGVLKNVSNSPKALPYLRITLVDGKNKNLASWLADPNATIIDKGQEIAFQSIYRKPPNVEVRAIVIFADKPKDVTAATASLRTSTDGHGEGSGAGDLLLGAGASASHTVENADNGHAAEVADTHAATNQVAQAAEGAHSENNDHQTPAPHAAVGR